MSQAVEITISEALQDWIDAQVQSGRYIDASDYIRHLIRRDQDAEQELVAALDDGAMSGVSVRAVDDIWADAAARAKRG